MPPQFFLDPKDLPTTVLFDLEGIRQQIPQRFEMEQLTAITLLDAERKMVVGYKDVTANEFWVRGHLPNYPLMPGVMMCEAAAQLSAFYCAHFKILQNDFIGFGGMNDVRFRGVVLPGQRLWLVGVTREHRSKRMRFEIQGIVEGNLVFHAEILGLAMDYPKDA